MFILSNVKTYEKNMFQHYWSVNFSSLIMFYFLHKVCHH